MKDRYLIISANGAESHLSYVDRDGLLAHLADAGEFSEESGIEPRFLEDVPYGQYGLVDPGLWAENAELILKVEVVVPQPVTTKWSV